MPRAGWVALVVAIGSAPAAVAQPLPASGPPLPATPVGAARSLPVLGAPVGVRGVDPREMEAAMSVVPAASAAPPPPAPPPIASAGFADDSARGVRAAAFGAPSAAGGEAAPPVPGAAVDRAAERTASRVLPSDAVHDLLAKRPDSGEGKLRSSSFSEEGGFADRLKGLFGTNHGDLFRSDHMFDGFISPVTNPFLFEDPRALTELRPVFVFQKVPAGQPDFHGGSVTFFGTQARVAFTDRWSLVVNKFGGESITTRDPSPYRDSTGFAEIWLGPKWTFFRGEETGSLAAAGLQFQLPVGSASAFQNTGSLSLSPYASYAQNFLRDFRLGSFNFMANTGFAFSVDKERSDYYWLSAHLDFDAGNLHRFYPLFELNWLVYTSNGKSTTIGSEGRDLINFGGQPKGSGLLTAAFGGRVKITESAQLGAAFEFPLAGREDLFRYRFTLDFILRY